MQLILSTSPTSQHPLFFPTTFLQPLPSLFYHTSSILHPPSSPYHPHPCQVKHFCPNVPIILVGNKKDLRSDEATKRELMKMKQVPPPHALVSHPFPTYIYIITHDHSITTHPYHSSPHHHPHRSRCVQRRERRWRRRSTPTRTWSAQPRARTG